MLVEKIKGQFKYTRENLREYFTVEVSGLFFRRHHEGMMIPRFYLPVWRGYDRYSLEVWIFPLAPFVWVFRLFTEIFRKLWQDMNDWLRLMYEIRRDSTPPQKKQHV